MERNQKVKSLISDLVSQLEDKKYQRSPTTAVTNGTYHTHYMLERNDIIEDGSITLGVLIGDEAAYMMADVRYGEAAVSVSLSTIWTLEMSVKQLEELGMNALISLIDVRRTKQTA
jgi:hypothetical protein